jgi:hypothetical protein
MTGESLLDQFKDHIAEKPVDKLRSLRTELLTKSVGGGEQTETERQVSGAYAKAIDDELARRQRDILMTMDRRVGNKADG